MTIKSNQDAKEVDRNIENGIGNSNSNGHQNLGYLGESNDDQIIKNSNNVIKNPNGEDIKKKSKTNEKGTPPQKDSQLWRDLVAFWILGLCNNYGYVVMLSAAHDIIDKFDHSEKTDEEQDNDRQCHILSTGAILLADIVPALGIKFLAPFLPFWVNFRILSAVLLSSAGFLLVGLSQYQWMALLGVVCTSLSSGLGETTLLAYSSRYNRNVVSTWSSGTGGAGVVGSLSYAGLIAIGISPVATMMIMLLVPFAECLAFWVLLRKPQKPKPNLLTIPNEEELSPHSHETPLTTLKQKLIYIIHLLKYMIPLTTVYLAEYFINQGLYELIYFDDISMDRGTQYRWLNAAYQIGVFISRSTVNLFTVDKLWIFPILQLLNVVYFTFEAIFYITPSIWIVFAVVVFEGLMGGGAYVNTFYKMSTHIPAIRRQFAIGFVATSDSVGITLAGFIAMPVHNAICRTPAPSRL